MSETWTYTFCDVAENHAGMQQLGTLCENPYRVKDLIDIKNNLDKSDIKSELIRLDDIENVDMDKAAILIIRNGISLFDAKDLEKLKSETSKLECDKKAYMKGKVVNKHARWNLCFSDYEQKADYENKKGTILKFEKSLKNIRDNLPKYFGNQAKNLNCELNYYYDINKCGIGYHGDSERRIVIGLRLGASMKLKYQWFKDSKPVGKGISLMLNDGDMYIMSQKAVGFDWKRKKIYTLRHAAGCKKYTNLNSKYK